MDQLEGQDIFDGSGKPQAAFTAATTDIITSSAHGMKNDDIVQLTTSNALPAGLAITTSYYVIDVTTDTFKLAITPGGVAVDVTGTGTGTHTFHLKGKAVLVRGYRHVVLHYVGTGVTNSTVKIQGSSQAGRPNFESTASATNKWDYVQIIDLEGATSLDGDTGIVDTAAEVGQQYEVNTNGLTWICANFTAWSAGAVALTATPYKN